MILQPVEFLDLTASAVACSVDTCPSAAVLYEDVVGRVFQLPIGISLDVETVTRIGALLGGIVSQAAEVRSSLKRRSVPSA